MYRIAVVDDVEQDAKRFSSLLHRYQEEKDSDIHLRWYGSAEDFLEKYQKQFDIVFMDIRMNGMDGMKAAHRLRTMDESVLLIFLTSLAQYAVQGYEVDAMDYILKPLTYPALELKLQKALKRCRKQTEEIIIPIGAERIRVEAANLMYVEVFEHHLQYKTSKGVLKGYGNLKDVEKLLPEKGFFRLNNQTIVNLRRVQRISGNTAMVDGRDFDISRMRKKDFLAEFHRFGVNG